MQAALNLAARCENARTLARMLGIEIAAATTMLDATVIVTFDRQDTAAALLTRQTTDLLQRTITRAGKTAHGHAAAEVVIGSASPITAAPKVWVTGDASRAVISRSRNAVGGWAQVHGAVSLITACYITAAALKLATAAAIPYPMPDPLILELDALGGFVAGAVDTRRSYLAGAGAVGNGFLWALQYFDVRGQLDVVDFDVVTKENLQRHIWFTEEDVDGMKADRLVERARGAFTGLQLTPRVSRLQDLPEKTRGPWLERLIVGVDSPRARRELQDEIPGEVFDASTTGVSEVVFHHHKQPTDAACLSCIYFPSAGEHAREAEIARHLGVSVADVRKLQIDEQAAVVIAAQFKDRGLTSAELVGQSYDSLFKALCAEAALRSPEGAQVLAPFAFVSVLAGTLLAIEFVRRCAQPREERFNYWTVSPWFPFMSSRQRIEARRPGCTFCGNAQLGATAARLWDPSAGV